jgi:heptosyltransferase-1
MKGEAPRILVIRLTSLGDVVMTLPAVEALRAAHPDARLAFLVDRRFATLPLGCPAVDEVIALDKRELLPPGPRAIVALLRLVRRLRQARYGAVADLQGYGETGLLALLSGSPVRVRRRGRALGACYTFEAPPLAPDRPLAEQHVELLALGGLVPRDAQVPPLRLVPAEASEAEADAWLAGAGLAGRGDATLALFVGASRPEKRWPLESFARLVEHTLAARREAIAVAFGGPQEGPALAELQARLGALAPRLRITPPFLPLPFVAALQRLRPVAFVSADTGPLHLAVASGATRVVGLFRHPNPHFEPGPPHRVLIAPSGDLARIGVEEVWAAIDAVAGG